MYIMYMVPAVSYESAAQGRANFKRLLDAAASGAPSQLRRDDRQIAIVDGERLRHYLGALLPAPEAAHEAGSWWIFVPGTSVSADGATFDDALNDAVIALREYAEDWVDHLIAAPNHRDQWGLVQFVALSTDAQLAEWLRGE